MILLGDSGVGKSSILRRYCDGTFDDMLSTIGIDFKIKTVERAGKKIKLSIWDTAGQERFRTISQAYCRGSQAIIFVYDVTDQSTFDHVTNWVDTIKRTLPDHKSVIKLLIGNKNDLTDQRTISTERGQRLADSVGMRFFETSASTGERVEALFDYMLSECLHKYVPDFNDPTVVEVDEDSISSRTSCCFA